MNKLGKHVLSSLEVLQNYNKGVKEGERRELARLIKLVDEQKVVYSPGSLYWPPDNGYSEGDEVIEVKSEGNEVLNNLLFTLESKMYMLKEEDKPE